MNQGRQMQIVAVNVGNQGNKEMQNAGNQSVENLNRNVAAPVVENYENGLNKESMILLNADDANEEVGDEKIHANCILKEKLHEVELHTKAANALVYETNPSAEVPNYDNYHDIDMINIPPHDMQHRKLQK
uniref:Uncharacterized protein n=1 Tax=Tanacetum cinerariifolium TaxID=118510 RepID=A0A699HS15_TANCI|nr:hypothetical protein [Tanacetum cinerariifolium]